MDYNFFLELSMIFMYYLFIIFFQNYYDNLILILIKINLYYILR